MADKKLEKKTATEGKQQAKPTGNARPAEKPAKKPRDKAIPVEKLNASNDE
jgi:hypothetical protein